jgi:uncharacterized cupredoxin-like copper-binding protein
VRRFEASLVTVAAVAAGNLASAAASSATTSAVLRAGYIATTNPRRAVTATVIAPTLRCQSTGRRAVTVGAFGTLDDTYNQATTTHTWSVAVRTVCMLGRQTSRARFDNDIDAPESVRVSPGDRVQLSVTEAQYFTLQDQTTGVGEVGAVPIRAGETIATNPRVFFGAQLSSPAPPTAPVRVLRARVGHESLGALAATARAARSGQQVVARPTKILPTTGGFRIVHVS